MKLTPELLLFIDLISESKMHLMLLAHGTQPRTEERRKELDDLSRCTAKARKYLDEHGGLESLPQHLAVEMRVCEKAVERFTKQERETAN